MLYIGLIIIWGLSQGELDVISRLANIISIITFLIIYIFHVFPIATISRHIIIFYDI